jgi:CheY-like chemotaxis protein
MRTIILTDDDEDDRDFFRTAIESTDSDVNLLTFNDGVCLSEYFDQNPDSKPQVIFLDINMPRMNGFECLAKLRQRFSPLELPVVMYTTSENDNDLQEASRLGANLYIRKPSDFRKLSATIHEVLKIDWNNHKTDYSTFMI